MAKIFDGNPKPKGARSPGSIANVQHHDPSMSEKDIAGSPATIEEIVADSTVKTLVEDFQVIRIMNTTATVHFVYMGEESATPGAAPTILNGVAIPPNFYENFYFGKREDGKSQAVKSSNVGVQIIKFES